MTHRIFALSLLFFILTTGCGPTDPNPGNTEPAGFEYSITTLSNPNWANELSWEANSINNNGSVVGGWSEHTGLLSTYYQNGSFYERSTFTNAVEIDVNNSEQSVGYTFLGAPSGIPTYNAFLVSDTEDKNLHSMLPPEFFSSIANGINDNGTVVGAATKLGGTLTDTKVIIWQDDSIFGITACSSTYSQNYANDINNSDTVVGSCMNSFKDTIAFLFRSSDDYTSFQFEGTSHNEFLAVNENDRAVGYVRYNTFARFPLSYHSSNNTYSIGEEQGQATDVNNDGTVVGTIYLPNIILNTPDFAFVSDLTNGLRNLNTLVDLEGSDFSKLTSATGINDAGVIVGEGIDSDGKILSFQLTPILSVLQ